jgi:hypothetical protein
MNEVTVGAPILIPQPTRAKRCDHLSLFTPGMAAHQHLAVIAFPNGEAWLAVIVGWATCHPATAEPAPAKPSPDNLSLHDLPVVRFFGFSAKTSNHRRDV